MLSTCTRKRNDCAAEAPPGPPSPVFTTHGGALDAARRLYPSAPRPWLDLSTGINPIAYPVGTIDPASWARLPDREGLLRLERTAARRYRIADEAVAVAAAGSQALIQRLPTLAPGSDVRLLGPSYGEYGSTFEAGGSPVQVVTTLDDLIGADVAIVVNPNNPDGRHVSPMALKDLADRVGLLVVDEAFADLLDADTTLGDPPSNAVTLRSFGKTYGLAGLRLGFALARQPLADTIRRLLGPWPVSGPAIEIGTRALADEDWLDRTRARLEADRLRLDRLLDARGCAIVGGTSLFRLVSHHRAPALFHHLASTGILVRPFADDDTHLRFGLPGARGDWDRLAGGLEAFA